MTIIHSIALLEMRFCTSFQHTSSMLYSVKFTKSNVLDIIDKLKTLNHNVENNISTGKHVGAPIETSDVLIVLNTLETIIEHYKAINKIQTISRSTKLYNMINEIRLNEEVSPKEIAKEVLNEVINPQKEAKKLTKKQKIAESATALSKQRKLDLLKIQTKQ